MSYLEMKAAPIKNTSKAIISLWFRFSASKDDIGAAPSGTAGPDENWDMTEFPPPPGKSGLPGINFQALVFGGPYGESVDFLLFPGPASLIPPAFPLGRTGLEPFDLATGHLTDIPPVLPHDKFNVLMTFGNPNIPFEHRPWTAKVISTFDGVIEFRAIAGFLLNGILLPFDGSPPPYWYPTKKWPGSAGPLAGTPLGNDGKLPCVCVQLDDSTSPRNIIPPSFIAVDDKHNLRIFLQTDTKADCKGYFYVQDQALALMAQFSRNYATQDDIMHGISKWGFYGPYFAGWQFTHKDQSNELMQQWPEYFVLQGPKVQEGWNHLLFSFDISGTVNATQNATPFGNAGPGNFGQPPIYWNLSHSESCSTDCQAWLALNDSNATDLQPSLPIPKYFAPPGFQGPSLVFGGQPTTWGGPIIRYFTPQDLKLGPNEIVPQSVFCASAYPGIPKYGLHQMWSSAAGNYGNKAYWASEGWKFYNGGGGFVSGHYGTTDQVTVPDPATFDIPTYQAGPFSIPTAGYPIGLPTGIDALDHNMGSDQAELQVWVGQTLDTSDKAMRRLFITEKGKPEKMQKAWDVLGIPDICLHGTGHWKTGFNTGLTGMRDDGSKIPSGQFKRTAKIEAFQPQPKLGK